MGTTRVRLTLEVEINGDIPADACTYFIGRFGNYSSKNFEAPVEDQVEQVILDMLSLQLPKLVDEWRRAAAAACRLVKESCEVQSIVAARDPTYRKRPFVRQP